jgi:integrase
VVLADLTLEKGLSAATVKPVYNLLNMILTKAVIDRKITFNPCDGLDTRTDLPREEEGDEMHFLRPEQVVLLADAIDPRFRALVYTAAYSGLRAGELSALKVSRTPLAGVEAIRPRLFVAEAHSEVRGRLVTKSTKNRRRRWVPIPQTLVDVLAEHVSAFPSEDGYVFTAPGGGPIRHHNFYTRHYKPAVLKAGLTSQLRFHDLRHTAAAILIDQGCNEKQLQVILGDTSRAIERYKHLFDGHEAALIERIDATLATSLGSPGVPVRTLTPVEEPAPEAKNTL